MSHDNLPEGIAGGEVWDALLANLEPQEQAEVQHKVRSRVSSQRQDAGRTDPPEQDIAGS